MLRAIWQIALIILVVGAVLVFFRALLNRNIDPIGRVANVFSPSGATSNGGA